MEALAPVVGVCFAVGCAFGGVSNYMNESRYENAFSNPDFFHLVDELGNPVSQKAE